MATRGSPRICPADFFVLRTPLLPIDDLLGWQAQNLVVNSEPLDERETIRRRLLEAALIIAQRPEVRHALFVASPHLVEGIDRLRLSLNPGEVRVRRSITKYLQRMTTRCTPFGLFAGCSVGRTSTLGNVPTQLRLRDRAESKIYCRLDFYYLLGLCSTLANEVGLVDETPLFANSSLQRVASDWHYIQTSVTSEVRSRHLIRLAGSPHLDAVLAAAQGGTTFSKLRQLLTGVEFSASTAEAEEFIRELTTSNVLVSDLSPLLTGVSALTDLIRALELRPTGLARAKQLTAVSSSIEALEAKGLLADLADYSQVLSTASQILPPKDERRFVEVDLVKPPADSVLGPDVLDEVTRAVEVLCRIGRASESPELARFRDDFVRRYERAWIPLSQALDDEIGVGFGTGNLDEPFTVPNLADQNRRGSTATTILPIHELLMNRLVSNVGTPREIRFDRGDLPDGIQLSSLPKSFSAFFTIAAPAGRLDQAADWTIWLKGLSGPSGARFLGRFCAFDSHLEDCVKRYLREEETDAPGAVFAEVVHSPEGRVGNVLCRPVLREHELVYLGRSGAEPASQITVDDLVVTVTLFDTIVLYSKRLKRRVIPRLTSAHGYNNPRLSSTYRFLTLLQHQDGKIPSFDWGPLASAGFLPRLRVGRTIIALARWRLSNAETLELTRGTEEQSFDVAQSIRKRRNLPRWVVLVDSDNRLPVDFDNPLSVDALVQLLTRRNSPAVLEELFPEPQDQCVFGPDGRYCHEIVLPLLRSSESKADPRPGLPPTEARESSEHHAAGVRSRFGFPGGNWVFVKVYGGLASLDHLLVDLGRFCGSCGEQGLSRRWFFIRYSDPETHLRLRIHGTDPDSAQRIAAGLSQLLAKAARRNQIWRFVFDTYQREVERYGGLKGISLSEDIFWADSEAVAQIVKKLGKEFDPTERLYVAALGVHKMLDDFGINLKDRRDRLRLSATQLGAAFSITAGARRSLGERFRSQRPSFQALLTDPAHPTSILIDGPLTKRSARIKKTGKALNQTVRRGELHNGIENLLSSYLHLHVNRVMRSNAQTSELIVYDFMWRIYDGELARTRA